ncbi:unnamed protein product, partial [marine sediment metagenome]
LVLHYIACHQQHDKGAGTVEGLTTHGTYLKNLLRQARRLTSTALSLVSLFAEEANRLNREDEASRLKALCSFIRQQSDQAKRGEDAASYGHTKADLISFLGGLAVSGAIKMVSKNKQLSAFADYLLENPISKERPFGMVLVCIGPKGLPDGVEVVSISRLARESDRQECDVINELQQRGYLLFSEEAFSLLVDRLINDVLEGRLLLPISVEKLTEIKTASYLEPEFNDSE